MEDGPYDAAKWGDDFDFKGERIYEDEDGRVHLSERAEEHEMVFRGCYILLPRGIFEGVGKGSLHAISYVWGKFTGDGKVGELERFLLMARIGDLTKQKDNIIRLYNNGQGR